MFGDNYSVALDARLPRGCDVLVLGVGLQEGVAGRSPGTGLVGSTVGMMGALTASAAWRGPGSAELRALSSQYVPQGA